MGSWALAIIVFFAPLQYFVGLRQWVVLPKVVFIQVGIALILFLWLLSRGGGKIRFPSITLPITLFLGWSAVSLFWATNPYDGFIVLLHWFCCALLIFLIVNLVTNPTSPLVAGALSGFIVAVYGILQIYGLACHIPIIGDIAPYTNRLGSFLGQGNSAGRFMVATLPFAVVLVWVIKGWARWLFVPIAGTILVFLYYSNCKAALVAIICMAALGLVLVFRKRSLLTVCVVVSLGTLVFLGIRGSDRWNFLLDPTELKSKARTEFIMPVLKSGGSIAGVGLGNTRVMYSSLSGRPERSKNLGYALRDLHNDYAQIGFELGYTGFLLMLFCMYKAGKLFYRNRANPVKTAMAMSVLGLAVTALFGFPAYQPISPMMVGLCLGIAEL